MPEKDFKENGVRRGEDRVGEGRSESVVYLNGEGIKKFELLVVVSLLLPFFTPPLPLPPPFRPFPLSSPLLSAVQTELTEYFCHQKRDAEEDHWRRISRVIC